MRQKARTDTNSARGERFWEKAGFVQTRLREGVQFGEQTNTLRVMFKPLTGGTTGGTLEQYLALISRDRPDYSS
jgi:hypothetical protein